MDKNVSGQMDFDRMIYSKMAHDDFTKWVVCGYKVQQWMYWERGVMNCPDWKVS
jgi:hypothetical protein